MKTRTISSLFLCLLILGMAMPGAVFAGGARGAQKLEGAWIARVDGIPGQWTYVVTADPSGRRASGHGSVDVGFRLPEDFVPQDKTSPLLVEFRMTGPETGVYSSIWYGLKELASTSPISHAVVWIGTSHGTLEFEAPNKIRGLHNFAFYDASQDVDGDGLPDPDQTPKFTTQLATNDTRLPSP